MVTFTPISPASRPATQATSMLWVRALDHEIEGSPVSYTHLEELKKRAADAEERLETLAGLSQEDAREVLLHKVDEELTLSLIHISGLLRNEWGFHGFIITDNANTGVFMDAGQMIQAGADGKFISPVAASTVSIRAVPI